MKLIRLVGRCVAVLCFGLIGTAAALSALLAFYVAAILEAVGEALLCRVANWAERRMARLGF